MKTFHPRPWLKILWLSGVWGLGAAWELNTNIVDDYTGDQYSLFHIKVYLLPVLFNIMVRFPRRMS